MAKDHFGVIHELVISQALQSKLDVLIDKEVIITEPYRKFQIFRIIVNQFLLYILKATFSCIKSN